LSLLAVPKGARVFLDAPVFLHHFAGTSLECRKLLERCERSEVRGFTSALVLARVAAALERMEAAPASDETAARASALSREDAVAKIPLMGVEVLPLDLRALLASGGLREKLGVGVAASLALTVALEAGASALCTTATDLERAEGLRVYRPSDTD
jgi:predicted nucleic acid-binding protein